MYRKNGDLSEMSEKKMSNLLCELFKFPLRLITPRVECRLPAKGKRFCVAMMSLQKQSSLLTYLEH